MKYASIGILVLALAAALALPASAQNTQAGESSPGSALAPGQPSTPGSNQASDTASEPGQATTTAAPTDAATKVEPRQKRAIVHTSITSLLQGGEEADKLQFQALDQHLQMLEASINQLRQLSSQPEQNAADIMRWSDIRDQHAQGVADVVSSYFLQQRLLPPTMPELGISSASATDRAREQAGIAGSLSESTTPGGTTPGTLGSSVGNGARTSQQADPMGQAYLDQLQTAHELLVRSRMVMHTSDPAEVRELRSLVTKLRSNQQQYQRQIEAHMSDMESRDGTEQAAREGEAGMEPGIDQPGERQATRPGEAGSSSLSPDTSATSPDTSTTSPDTSSTPTTDSSSSSPSATPAPGTSDGQGGTSGSTTP